MNILYRWIFPSACIWCGKEVLVGDALCGPCFSRLQVEAANSRKINGGTALQEACVYVANYSGAFKKAIIQWKVANNYSLTRQFAQLMHVNIPMDIWNLPVTSIPGHKMSIRKRGWDASSELGKALAKMINSRWIRLIERHSKSDMQKKLGREDRYNNASDMLYCRRDIVPPAVILVDDVRTTGETMSAGERILLEHGCKQIHSFVLAQD